MIAQSNVLLRKFLITADNDTNDNLITADKNVSLKHRRSVYNTSKYKFSLLRSKEYDTEERIILIRFKYKKKE